MKKIYILTIASISFFLIVLIIYIIHTHQITQNKITQIQTTPSSINFISVVSQKPYTILGLNTTKQATTSGYKINRVTLRFNVSNTTGINETTSRNDFILETIESTVYTPDPSYAYNYIIPANSNQNIDVTYTIDQADPSLFLAATIKSKAPVAIHIPQQ